MHIPYWNLTENPFQNVADTRFAFPSPQHREALARLLYLVDGRKLGGILYGPYGCGKSLVLELLADELKDRDSIRYLRCDASPAGPLAVIQTLLRKLDWTQPVQDVSQALMAFEEICGEGRGPARHLVLAIDEAQFFEGQEAEAFLHLFTNLRILRKNGSYGASAGTLLLSGPPSVLQRVAANPSLAQRMQTAAELSPLDLNQTVEYVHYRIRRAGGDIWMFDRDALDELHGASGGIPRLINNLCDIALVLGSAASIRRIDLGMIRQAIADYRRLNPTVETPS